MMSHEKLLENYEDALFALLMEQVAEEEGALLYEQNETLKLNAEAAVPESIDRKCRMIIARSFNVRRLKEAGRIITKAFNKVAVICFVSLMLYSATYAVVPEVRIKTLNLLIEVSNVATSLSFGNSGDSTTGSEPYNEYYGYDLGVIPKGFALTGEGHDSRLTWVEYTDKNGANIYLRFGGSLSLINNVDTEDADSVEQIWVRGYEGLLVEKEGSIQIAWADLGQEIFINVYCKGIDKESFIMIVQNL